MIQHTVTLTENERQALLNLLEREQWQNGLSAAQSNALKALRSSESAPVTAPVSVPLFPGGAA